MLDWLWYQWQMRFSHFESSSMCVKFLGESPIHRPTTSITMKDEIKEKRPGESSSIKLKQNELHVPICKTIMLETSCKTTGLHLVCTPWPVLSRSLFIRILYHLAVLSYLVNSWRRQKYIPLHQIKYECSGDSNDWFKTFISWPLDKNYYYLAIIICIIYSNDVACYLSCVYEMNLQKKPIWYPIFFSVIKMISSLNDVIIFYSLLLAAWLCLAWQGQIPFGCLCLTCSSPPVVAEYNSALLYLCSFMGFLVDPLGSLWCALSLVYWALWAWLGSLWLWSPQLNTAWLELIWLGLACLCFDRLLVNNGNELIQGGSKTN